MVESFLKFLRNNKGQAAAKRGEDAPRITRRSNGLNELSKSLKGLEGRVVLDLGPTSPANIEYFTSLGQRTYNEDVLRASRDAAYVRASKEGGKTVDEEKFLAENLQYQPSQFDAVLCWDLPDYLNEALVKPAVGRIQKVLKPGGILLAFFHTKDAGPDAPYHRYHIAGADMLELQRIPLPAEGGAASGPVSPLRLQRVFNNRHIENLFRDFSSIKFFLGRDNIREVLVVR